MKKLIYSLVFLGLLSTNTGGSSQIKPEVKQTAPDRMSAEIDNASVKMGNLKSRLDQMNLIIKATK